jgi:hypothetical protein
MMVSFCDGSCNRNNDFLDKFWCITTKRRRVPRCLAASSSTVSGLSTAWRSCSDLFQHGEIPDRWATLRYECHLALNPQNPPRRESLMVAVATHTTHEPRFPSACFYFSFLNLRSKLGRSLPAYARHKLNVQLFFFEFFFWIPFIVLQNCNYIQPWVFNLKSHSLDRETEGVKILPDIRLFVATLSKTSSFDGKWHMYEWNDESDDGCGREVFMYIKAFLPRSDLRKPRCSSDFKAASNSSSFWSC